MQVSDELARLFANLGRTLNRGASEGMPSTDFVVLKTVGASLDGLRLSDLAELVGLDASTMSRRVAALIEHELIERSTHPGDRRASVLTLSPTGREALATERARRVRLVTTTLSEWDTQELDHLATMLCRLNESIEAAYE